MASPTILLIEDDADDAALIVDGLARAIPREHVAVCRHGSAALDFLQRRGEFANRADDLPILALIDVGLPQPDGFAVLREIRSEPGARLLPVTLLSASDDPQDVRMAAELGANSFVRKPADRRQLAERLEQLARYWLELNIPPPCGTGQ